MVLSNADLSELSRKLAPSSELPERIFAGHSRRQDGWSLRESKFRSQRKSRGLPARLRTLRHCNARCILWSSAMQDPLSTVTTLQNSAIFQKNRCQVDCVVASNADSSHSAPPDCHILTCFVQYVPYRLRTGDWDSNRELLGDRVVKKIAGTIAPNVPNAIIARQVLTPARSGTHLWAYRGKYFPRRIES